MLTGDEQSESEMYNNLDITVKKIKKRQSRDERERKHKKQNDGKITREMIAKSLENASFLNDDGDWKVLVLKKQKPSRTRDDCLTNPYDSGFQFSDVTKRVDLEQVIKYHDQHKISNEDVLRVVKINNRHKW